MFLTFPGALKTLANPLHVFKETCDNIGHTTTVVIAGFHRKTPTLESRPSN